MKWIVRLAAMTTLLLIGFVLLRVNSDTPISHIKRALTSNVVEFTEFTDEGTYLLFANGNASQYESVVNELRLKEFKRADYLRVPTWSLDAMRRWSPDMPGHYLYDEKRQWRIVSRFAKGQIYLDYASW